MDNEEQNEKHVVGDKTEQKKMEGTTHQRGQTKDSPSWFQKLIDFFK
ncbi:hypothetical protein [Marixanthomonas spongiae]|nr:hypothetical protein [Marixanthomonas spongiae]